MASGRSRHSRFTGPVYAAVASGTDVLPPALTSTLFSHIAKLALRRKPTEVAEAVRMTARERAVFDLIADGLSNKEIGERLHVATNTSEGARPQHSGEAGPPYAPADRGRTRGAAASRNPGRAIRTDPSNRSRPSHLDDSDHCRSVRSIAARSISPTFARSAAVTSKLPTTERFRPGMVAAL